MGTRWMRSFRGTRNVRSSPSSATRPSGRRSPHVALVDEKGMHSGLAADGPRLAPPRAPPDERAAAAPSSRPRIRGGTSPFRPAHAELRRTHVAPVDGDEHQGRVVASPLLAIHRETDGESAHATQPFQRRDGARQRVAEPRLKTPPRSDVRDVGTYGARSGTDAHSRCPRPPVESRRWRRGRAPRPYLRVVHVVRQVIQRATPQHRECRARILELGGRLCDRAAPSGDEHPWRAVSLLLTDESRDTGCRRLVHAEPRITLQRVERRKCTARLGVDDRRNRPCGIAVWPLGFSSR